MYPLSQKMRKIPDMIIKYGRLSNIQE